MPIEPFPSAWSLPDPENAPDAVGDLVGVGADLDVGTLLAAYRTGLFPMPLPDDVTLPGDDLARIGWWSPDPRGILPLNELRVSRSLRRSYRRYEIRVNTAFEQTIRACADPSREHGWIDENIVRAYTELHHLGWAHSIETWDPHDGTLAGGLYGVAIGGLFAGESMFHRKQDASKVALVALVEHLIDGDYTLLDVQWTTDHLASLGAVDVPRRTYLAMLADALTVHAKAFGAFE